MAILTFHATIERGEMIFGKLLNRSYVYRCQGIKLLQFVTRDCLELFAYVQRDSDFEDVLFEVLLPLEMQVQAVYKRLSEDMLL